MKRIALVVGVTIVFGALMSFPTYAQKGLYVGANLGHCGNGGKIEDKFEPDNGANLLLGFKVTHKIGVELEYGAYGQDPKEDFEAIYDKAAFGGFGLNFKFFSGRPRAAFKPYFVLGLGINALVWEYAQAGKALVGEDKDGVGAVSLTPGVGFELMIGRIAALNLCGRFFLNGWADETSEGHKNEGDIEISGNTLLLNLGLILHL